MTVTFNQMVDSMKDATPRNQLTDVLHYTANGSIRRNLIAELVTGDVKVLVNARYCRQVHLDPDLTKLIKDGTHEVISEYINVTHKKQYFREKPKQ